MPLHDDSIKVLELNAMWSPDELTVASVRLAEERRYRELEVLPRAAGERLSIPTSAEPAPSIVYRPDDDRPDGVLVYLHGGGWTTGSPELTGPQAVALANAGNCVVVSVRYRLAPENPFPAALEDAYAAACWVAGRSEQFGVPPGTTVVGGPSSGGNLAAAVCLVAQDRGQPTLAGQLLLYPSLARDIETASRREFADGYGLTTRLLSWYWDNYLPSDEDAMNPYVSPLLATNLTALPRAIVVTAEYDILRDEGETYAKRLHAAGVPVAQRRYDGMVHGFLGYESVVEVARRALDWIGLELQLIFAAATASPGDRPATTSIRRTRCDQSS